MISGEMYTHKCCDIIVTTNWFCYSIVFCSAGIGKSKVDGYS